MAFSGFQSNTFQPNSFQIVGGNAGLLGGGPGEQEPYNPHIFQYRQKELREQALAKHKAELKKIEEELADKERRRLENLTALEEKRLAKKAAKELAALEALLQEQINRLRMERVWLMRLIDNEEAILIILMMKRRRFI